MLRILLVRCKTKLNCSYNSVFYKYHSYYTYYTYNTKYNTNYIIKYYTNNGLRRGSGELFLKKLANFVETRTEKLLLNCAPAIGLMHVHPQVLPISLASLSGKLRHCCLLPAHRNARRRKIWKAAARVEESESAFRISNFFCSAK